MVLSGAPSTLYRAWYYLSFLFISVPGLLSPQSSVLTPHSSLLTQPQVHNNLPPRPTPHPVSSLPSPTPITLLRLIELQAELLRMHITHSEKSLQECHQMESHDTKYVSGLSTILVATIQEAKDRISQIEYIFCSQLYPNFQNKSTSLQKLYSEARSAAENEWKERQTELEVQRELALDECKTLRSEKSELLTKVTELEDKLFQKSKEVDDGIELHATLVKLIETKTTSLQDIEQQMKESEQRMKFLVTKSEELERKIDVLNKELQVKSEEVIKEKKLAEDLWKQVESQTLKIANNEQLLSSSEQEKKEISMKLGNLEASLYGLRNELSKKVAEVDEGKHLQEKLLQQVSLFSTGLKENQQMYFHEKENQMLLSSVNQLQNKGEEFQESVRIPNAGVTSIGEPHNDLAKQIELISSQLAAEKGKKGDVVIAYKRLKSQYCFLLKKYGLTDEDLLRQMKVQEEESNTLNNEETNIALYESKKRNPASNVAPFEFDKVKQENILESSDDCKIGRPNKAFNSKIQSGSNSPIAAQWTTSGKVRSLAGGKRPRSGWRETRSRQSPGGPDPHDDFLDTPYENIRGNLYKTMKNGVRVEVPTERLKDMYSDDDETQDTKAECGPKRQQLLQASGSGPKGFKYVEPVRKKGERENLYGIECKQCQTFYDAVLSDTGAKNGEADKPNFRCEHHYGVSRHRYRYVPPMTPEGFWNIGFDTET